MFTHARLVVFTLCNKWAIMLADTAMKHYTRLLNELANLPRPKLQELGEFIQALLARPEVRGSSNN